MSDDPISPIKVIIEHKKTIQETIPEDVTREKIGRWLDIISPVTEWCGLVGDKLHHKRQLLRLEQESTLFELAEKLKPKLEGKTITPIPAKQLIPILEKSSLEKPGSEFIDKWANLLASAATDPGDDTQTCTSILAELGHNEAELLDTIQQKLMDAGIWPDNLESRYRSIHEFVKEKYATAKNIMLEVKDEDLVDEFRNQQLSELFADAPLLVLSLNLTKSENVSKQIGLQFSEEQRIAIDIIEYRNLVKRESYRTMANRSPGLLSVTWFNLTDLGIRFLRRVSGK